ncbi:S1 family peptidase [Arthrobacter gengyunqii]|uniref:S1 family peptidase n=1 Tax=Arthrobacter gengyunqii TaxID=2886940 RepID=A0ABS8GHZ6_9MICC|nr:S1 family peptidase [Arthrobacter gengyunqii]MCC3266076.1 S1 family peptidase [Arthrobacter gengyunqii]
MQDNSSAFYKRVGALGAATALAVSGAFIASPALAAPAAEPEATAPATATTEAPVDETVAEETVAEETVTDVAAPVEEAPAEEAGALAPGLAEALLRDLGMTVEEFEAAGELGKKAAAALPELQATEGFVSIAIEDGKIVITGSGESLEAITLNLGATLVAPAIEESDVEASEPVVEATEAATDAPSTEATEPATAEDDKAASLDLSGNYLVDVPKIRNAYISSVGVEGLQSIMLTADGYVIRVDKAATVGRSVLSRSMADAAVTPADAFGAQHHNITVVNASGPAKALEDVVNGQGYATFTGESAGVCSIGFNAFNADGDPAVISAGHCADDGQATDTVLTVPSGDDASGGTQPALASPLGTWGFSQFGGENNSPTELGSLDNIGTDIGVIDGINSELDLLPEVTQWSDAEDLTADTVKVTAAVDAVVGAAMCKSGRTTGWSCGTVAGLGEFYVGAEDGVRGVLGFESTMPEINGAPGDSGGSVISGSNAIGLVSAGPDGTGGPGYFFSTSLTDGMKRLGGYSVAVFVEAPVLTSHEDKGTVLTDEAIRGTATTSTVNLTRGDDTIKLDVVDGTWSFPAPSTVPADGELAFKVQAVDGFNKSKTVSYELNVKEAPLAAPVITTPADGADIADSVATITGKGFKGAEVSLKLTGTDTRGDDESANSLAAVTETGTVTVDEDGNWEWKLDEALSYGAYTVTATQDGIDGKAKSSEATSKFSVILNKPAITSIDGQDFTEGSNPSEVKGTGTAKAAIAVTIGETTLETTVANNGSWSVNGFPTDLAPGTYTVSAVQSLSGATSAAAEATFTVTAVVIEEQAPPVVPPAPQPGDPAPTTPAPAPDNNGDGLPDTGAAGMGLFAGAGALLTVGGISALLINRRRQMQDA